MRIVVINGTAGVGKDIFVTFCVQHLGTDRVSNTSTVDYVKAVAMRIGWDGIKDDKGRTLLSQLKKIMADYADIPYLRTVMEIESFRGKMAEIDEDHLENSVIFVHCREPKEIQRFVEEFNAETLLIRRELAEEKNWENASDKGVLDYPYDCVIHNDGSLEQLRAVAAEYLKNQLGLVI